MTQENTSTRTVSWEDPAQSLALAADMSGPEYIRAIFEGRLSPPRLWPSLRGCTGSEAYDPERDGTTILEE